MNYFQRIYETYRFKITGKRTTDFEKSVKTLYSHYVADYEAGVYSVSAFFTALVDYEHSGTEFNFKQIETNDEMAWLYFGTRFNEKIEVFGYQTKNLYPLMKFIEDNGLWPEMVRTKHGYLSRMFLRRKKYHLNIKFSNVVNSIENSKNPELYKLLRSYPLILLRIAYFATAEIGVEKLKTMQPFEAGRLAFRLINKAKGKRVNKGFVNFLIFHMAKLVKVFFRVGLVAAVIGTAFWAVSSGYLSLLG
ncbi:hypothetical protein ATI02_4340 [Pseudomonas baetica]|uniref:Uncharacterized protein n=1 Tax=Pseudomonas baetica TaxID=674054 RepID=A0ABX4Q3J5_9PSED|nr:hypothetical protein [Pseudomonas baetica]PKA71362.1 hypothetical protein ATI02_4340 [Pseudomonas baetica]PTC19860.1 hypothetical protein C0J26_07635 [Pseudomonas baetica]